ncbi:hypothetical protein GCM10023335_07170 [Streptomyces siamensis]|uniref:Uncharacterized protein n=1 Tax=Streptomyces siamensis TaxID=1274986 RepID=A0ABP9IFV0_9ACTN
MPGRGAGTSRPGPGSASPSAHPGPDPIPTPPSAHPGPDPIPTPPPQTATPSTSNVCTAPAANGTATVFPVRYVSVWAV